MIAIFKMTGKGPPVGAGSWPARLPGIMMFAIGVIPSFRVPVAL